MTGPITRHRTIESLKTAAHRPGTDQATEAYQQFDPFKFLIYAELAGAEIGPVE